MDQHHSRQPEPTRVRPGAGFPPRNRQLSISMPAQLVNVVTPTQPRRGVMLVLDGLQCAAKMNGGLVEVALHQLTIPIASSLSARSSLLPCRLLISEGNARPAHEPAGFHPRFWRGVTNRVAHFGLQLGLTGKARFDIRNRLLCRSDQRCRFGIFIRIGPADHLDQKLLRRFGAPGLQLSLVTLPSAPRSPGSEPRQAHPPGSQTPMRWALTPSR